MEVKKEHIQILIVEDEPHAANHLQHIIAECCSGAQFYPVLDSLAAASSFLQLNLPVDVLFLDIHLSDGEAFDLFDAIPPALPVIFTTAYDEYIMKAFEVNSINYLLKPISKEKIERAMLKFEQLREAGNIAATQSNQRQQFIATNKLYKENFLIPYRDKLLPVPANDIICFEIRNGVVIATRANQKTLIMEERSLEELVAHINPQHFFRANRQYLVNKAAIKEVSQHINGKLSIRLQNHLQDGIFISRDKATEFKRWMRD